MRCVGRSRILAIRSHGVELCWQPLTSERLVGGVYKPYPVFIKEDGTITSYSELLDLIFSWNEVGRFDILDTVPKRTIDQIVIEHTAWQPTEACARAKTNSIDYAASNRGNRRRSSLAEIAATRKIHNRGFADTTKSQQMRYEYENESNEVRN